MLRVERIKVSYDEVPALHEVSFKVEKGQIVSIIGANGAGKSTILK
ncbi:MAG: ATP-binding cassette domain-containing protein, partial [Deltaproteobacteria bacterium]|nr:ATP-binding cassette domain-containing protein [Deltaproteobacteria bacterium]